MRLLVRFQDDLTPDMFSWNNSAVVLNENARELMSSMVRKWRISAYVFQHRMTAIKLLWQWVPLKLPRICT